MVPGTGNKGMNTTVPIPHCYITKVVAYGDETLKVPAIKNL